MKRERQTKWVSIIALCVAVVGLTLGFAAFSNTLTISSSATVSPNASDFKITVLGLNEEAGNSDLEEEILDINNYITTASYPRVGTSIGSGGEKIDHNNTATPAVIDNNNLTISNISVNMSYVGEFGVYYFVLRNDGEYDAYFDVDSFKHLYDGVNGTCTADEGTSVDLVNQACNAIFLRSAMISKDGEAIIESVDKYKIEKGEYVFLTVLVEYQKLYNNIFADGDFLVKFDDLKLKFSTAK